MLADEIARVLPSLRAEAEARMTSRVTIYRKGAPTPSGDLMTPSWSVVASEVPFRLGKTGDGTQSRTVRVGETEVQVSVRTGHFPATFDDLADGDFLEVTAGENVGRVYRVVEVDWSDQATARRVPVVADQAPEGGWS